MKNPFRLYYITDRKSLAPAPLLPRVEAAIRAGVDLIQIREKDLPTRELAELVAAAVRCAKGTPGRIVVNDRLDVALEAHGVHLGRQSLPASAVRKNVPENFLVGVSTHSRAEALAAESDGADYILFGPIFETPSKAGYGSPLGLSLLAEVAARVEIPVIALGGITPERVCACLGAGAAGIAGIRIFQNCDSVEERVREMRALWPSDSTPR
jgi:thiamine-phosphate pyrophosphorylase